MKHSKIVPSNIDFGNINDYSLQLSRWFLASLGVWPGTDASSRIKRILVSMQILILMTSVAVIMVPCILYICFEKEDMQTRINAMFPVFHRLMGWWCYWMLFKRNRDIHNCIRHMEMDWKLVQRLSDREVMLQNAKMGRFIAGFCAIFMYGGTFLFSIVKMMKTKTIIVDNETFTMHPMTCPMYSKLLDIRFSPVNEIMLSVQLLSAFVVTSATVAVCSLATVFAMHASGQLRVLYVWMHEFVENYEKKSNLKELATIVEHHLRVLSFITQMESIMHKICFAELIGCTLNMCLLGYYSVTNWSNFDGAKISSYIIAYISISFNIFIFCYVGEILTEQCKTVGDMAYTTNWYKLPHKTALCFVLIIMRSNNVIKITAGKLFQLSITTFGDIIKTSMTYLNILRTMTVT